MNETDIVTKIFAQPDELIVASGGVEEPNIQKPAEIVKSQTEVLAESIKGIREILERYEA